MSRLLALIILGFTTHTALADGRDSITLKDLNAKRIHTNMVGMRVLGIWGIANTLTGVAGAVAAKDEEWQHFHQMNTAWGVVNLGIAVMGYMGAQRELRKPLSNHEGLHRYESAKRLYLVNAGLDGLYIATGAFLTERAKTVGNEAPLYRGFGKSLILQGAGLLVFDVNMFLAHHRRDKGWYRALQGVCVTGNGIGWRWKID